MPSSPWSIRSYLRKHSLSWPSKDGHIPMKELLDSLRRLLVANGTLSYRIMKNSPNLASMNTFIRRFGTLRRAFELAGQTYPWTVIGLEHCSQVKRMRDELLRQIKSLFSQEVSVCRPDPEAPEYIQVDEVLKVIVVVCPATRKNRCITWVADSGYAERKTVTLLARLTGDNREFRDFYVLPAPGRHWIRHRGELQEGKRLLNLSDFCSVARAVASLRRNGRNAAAPAEAHDV
jgi:hypothetical protein